MNISNQLNHGPAVGDVAPQRVEIEGEIVRRLSWAPIRVIAVISGLILVRGVLVLLARYCLGLRRRATAVLAGSSLVLEVEWSILGRRVKREKTIAPLGDLRAVRLERRQRYLNLLVGFGALAVSTWLGVHWLLDGLRAGYPYLALIGAGVVLVGIVIDLILYFVVPAGKGSSRLLLALGPWKVGVAGVQRDRAEYFLAQFEAQCGRPLRQPR